jgi:hypothetical protein
VLDPGQDRIQQRRVGCAAAVHFPVAGDQPGAHSASVRESNKFYPFCAATGASGERLGARSSDLVKFVLQRQPVELPQVKLPPYRPVTLLHMAHCCSY